jgi:hypothetical protein
MRESQHILTNEKPIYQKVAENTFQIRIEVFYIGLSHNISTECKKHGIQTNYNRSYQIGHQTKQTYTTTTKLLTVWCWWEFANPLASTSLNIY